MPPNTAWWKARLANLEAVIEHYETAILAFDDPTMLSYDLDTGQSRHRVTRQNLDDMTQALMKFYEQYSRIELRVCGGGSVVLRPHRVVL